MEHTITWAEDVEVLKKETGVVIQCGTYIILEGEESWEIPLKSIIEIKQHD